MSLTDVTTAAAWIAGLAIVALIASGWRKPARATADPLRVLRDSSYGVEVEPVPVPLHHRTPWWRRVWAVAASGAMAVIAGAVIAIVVAAVVATTVVGLTEMLRR